jgi:hypothetical protein
VTSTDNLITGLLDGLTPVPLPQKQGAVGVSVENAEGQFVDLLGNLLGLVGAPQDTILPLSKEFPQIPIGIEKQVTNNPPAWGTPPAEDHPIPVIPIVDGRQPLIVEKDNSPVLINRPVTNLTRESLLKPQATVESTFVRDTFNAPAQAIETGEYEILESYVGERTQYFKVANKHDKQDSYTISVPLPRRQAVTLPLPMRSTALTPLEFDSFGYKTTGLEDYYSKLNLREIEITPNDQQKPARLFAEPALAIVAGQNMGQEVTIRSKLLKQSPKIRTQERPVILESAEGENGSVELIASEKRPVPTVNTPRALPQGTAVDRNSMQIENAFLFEKANIPLGQKETLGKQDGGDVLSVLESVQGDRKDVVPEKIDPQPVRFTLPDHVKTTLKPNGQAVNLRIEPEHLGPARLSLVMNNDKLRARVVVENYQIKAAVEASLDRLVDQLSRADIKVDHIEVNVDGDSARNSLFGRPPQWRHRAPMAGLSHQNDSAVTEDGLPGESAMPHQTSYVGAGGVNLLA